MSLKENLRRFTRSKKSHYIKSPWMFHVYIVIIRSYKYKTYHSREVELLELLLLNADGLEVVPELGVSL